MQRVEVLNVAGPRASKDPEIYGDVFEILEQTIQIIIDEDNKSGTLDLELMQSGKLQKHRKTLTRQLRGLVPSCPLKTRPPLQTCPGLN